jgi:AP-1 complex subunit sigma 1/2
VYYSNLSFVLTDKLVQILDELIIAGELQESSKKSVLRVVRILIAVYPTYPQTLYQYKVTQSDSVEEQENSEDTMARLGSRHG